MNQKLICTDDYDDCCDRNCADDIDKCLENPKVFKMTGNNVDILCAEWETGEEYNALLPIKLFDIQRVLVIFAVVILQFSRLMIVQLKGRPAVLDLIQFAFQMQER